MVWEYGDVTPLSAQREGLFLRRMADGALIQIESGGYWGPAWSPDGKRLASNGLPEGRQDNVVGDFSSQLYLLDPSSVLGE